MNSVLLPWTDRFPVFVLIPVLTVLVALPCGAGYIVARRRRKAGAKQDESLPTIVGATLGLLAFMLAFAFNGAYDRYETRRQLTITDANAIELTYRQAGMLPIEAGAKIQNLLKEYLDTRLQAATPNRKASLDAIKRSDEILNQIGEQANHAVVVVPTSPLTRLLIDSISEMTRSHTLRVTAALRTRTPSTIWFTLFLMIMYSMSAMGYQYGLSSEGRRLPMLLAIVAFATVIALIADLDRPQEGLVRVNQGALEDLRHRLFDRQTPSD